MADLLTPALGPDDHVDGPADAPLELVMYGDFQCPYCSAAQGILRRVRDRLDGRLRFAFRHFPIPEIHPDAQRAAEASEAAAAQGAFWPMHDALYGAQKSLSDRRMVELAVALGLPGAAAAITRAWAEHTFIPRVKEDFASGLKSGVTGTPAFFINGVRHEGGWDEIALSHAIEVAAR